MLERSSAGTLRAAPVLDQDLPFESVSLKAIWFSANTWGNGSIFGNVEFGTPWQALVAERKFYWLGVRERNLTAFRFLLTSDESIPSQIGLKRYDPMTDAGPVQYHMGTWLRRVGMMSEFLVDADLSLSLCTQFGAVTHNRDENCVRYKGGCIEQGSDCSRTAGRVIAYVLGNERHSIDGHGARSGSDIRSPGGARVCRGPRPRKVLRPSQP
jgi:hypothetical protein